MLTGTFDELCFYQMEGAYYVRRKSSLSGKRFKKDAAFAGSRRSAVRFGEGNRLASAVYRLVAKERRAYALFCFLKRKSILLLKAGNTLAEAEAALRACLADFGLTDDMLQEKAGTPEVAPSSQKPKTSAPRCSGTKVFIKHKVPACKTVSSFYPTQYVLYSATVPYYRRDTAFLLYSRLLWQAPPGRGVVRSKVINGGEPQEGYG